MVDCLAAILWITWHDLLVPRVQVAPMTNPVSEVLLSAPNCSYALPPFLLSILYGMQERAEGFIQESIPPPPPNISHFFLVRMTEAQRMRWIAFLHSASFFATYCLCKDFALEKGVENGHTSLTVTEKISNTRRGKEKTTTQETKLERSHKWPIRSPDLSPRLLNNPPESFHILYGIPTVLTRKPLWGQMGGIRCPQLRTMQIVDHVSRTVYSKDSSLCLLILQSILWIFHYLMSCCWEQWLTIQTDTLAERHGSCLHMVTSCAAQETSATGRRPLTRNAPIDITGVAGEGHFLRHSANRGRQPCPPPPPRI